MQVSLYLLLYIYFGATIYDDSVINWLYWLLGISDGISEIIFCG